MRYLLDTNIISKIVQPRPPVLLVAWMASQADQDLFITSLTIAEISRGLLEKPASRRRDELMAWFSGSEGPRTLFAGRILSFDEKAALVWGRLMADGKSKGRPRNALDTIIAAIAEVHGCIVVTDNERDFIGVELLNPLRAKS